MLPLILVASIVAISGSLSEARPDLERLQMRWLVAAFGSISPISSPHQESSSLAAFDPNAEIAWVPASVAFMLPPIAIGIAVTRYRLYEIDRLISRGLSWAVLSGLLLAVYAGAILLLQSPPRRPDPGPDRGRGRVHAARRSPVPAPSAPRPDRGRPPNSTAPTTTRSEPRSILASGCAMRWTSTISGPRSPPRPGVRCTLPAWA